MCPPPERRSAGAPAGTAADWARRRAIGRGAAGYASSMALTSLLDTALDRTLIGYGNVGYMVRRRSWREDDPPAGALRGKVAIVTGAKTGLGRATAKGLAELGAEVHMAVRGRDQGEQVREDILREVPGAEIAVDECDVSSIASVRAYAERFEGPLHVLIHNAGVMPDERQVSEDGTELTLATHVVGPHLLTALLRPALKQGAPSRVIWVASGGMYGQKLRVDDLQTERDTYRPAAVYARTKRAQVILAQEWGERLRDDGILVHAVHPGWVDTPGVARWLPKFKALTRPLLRTPEQGADTFVWVAAAERPGRCTGRFWHDREPRPLHYVSRTKETAADRRALWDEVQRLAGLERQAPPAQVT
jgi:dehydrogenase/reductase SDR family protein 12